MWHGPSIASAPPSGGTSAVSAARSGRSSASRGTPDGMWKLRPWARRAVCRRDHWPRFGLMVRVVRQGTPWNQGSCQWPVECVTRWNGRLRAGVGDTAPAITPAASGRANAGVPATRRRLQNSETGRIDWERNASRTLSIPQPGKAGK